MLQNGAAFWKLLDDLFITKRGKGYNKLGQLLGFITKWAVTVFITKRGKVCYKIEQLFENYWMIFLLQNRARVITKRGSFFITKRGNGYNKMRQLLRFITKWGKDYNKMGQLWGFITKRDLTV